MHFTLLRPFGHQDHLSIKSCLGGVRFSNTSWTIAPLPMISLCGYATITHNLKDSRFRIHIQKLKDEVRSTTQPPSAPTDAALAQPTDPPPPRQPVSLSAKILGFLRRVTLGSLRDRKLIDWLMLLTLLK